MNYLPTNCIFKKFGLVCKRFHNLTSGIEYLNGKIFDQEMSAIVLKIVKKSRAIVALNLEVKERSFWWKFSEHFIIEALMSCQKLKSLRISGDCELKMDIIEILKQFGPQLEHLAVENLNTSCEVFIEISKLKFLKSLGIRSLNITNHSYTHHAMMTKVVQNLQLANQLECIDFEFDSLRPEILNLYNQLINEKKDTLRKIGLTHSRRRYTPCQKLYGSPCVSFETINQCTNLEELSGRLHIHEFQNVKTKLKRLLTGKINDSHEFGMFAQMNRINLEHIEIEMKREWFASFANLKFPALRYLMINIENYTNFRISLEVKDLYNLLKNSPNLKALRFKGNPFLNMTEGFIFKIFQTKGIVISTNDNAQDFEMANFFYSNHIDYQLFEKFKASKTLFWKQFSNSEPNKGCANCR